jgi:hypothetical protein
VVLSPEDSGMLRMQKVERDIESEEVAQIMDPETRLYGLTS